MRVVGGGWVSGCRIFVLQAGAVPHCGVGQIIKYLKSRQGACLPSSSFTLSRLSLQSLLATTIMNIIMIIIIRIVIIFIQVTLRKSKM